MPDVLQPRVLACEAATFVPEIHLHRQRIVSLARKVQPARMTKHCGMNLKFEISPNTGAFEDFGKTEHSERFATVRDEHKTGPQ